MAEGNSLITFIEKLKKLLDLFERNKEWADLVNWLNKVNEVLKTPGLKKIPFEEILAKRLSQCLNQALPNSVHVLTLETYGLIFQFHCGSGNDTEKSAPWGNSLAFYSPGLFSFYQFAKLEVKIKFNNLIKKYYLRLGSEILSCLNGLMSILLLGLDDQNEEALKGIEDIMQGLEQMVGTRIFYGSIWLAILRTSKIRFPALRYLIKSIPTEAENFPLKKLYISKEAYKVSNVENGLLELKVERNDSEKPITDTQLLYNFYPQKESLVVNALIQCLQDEAVFTQRCTFDFLGSHMPLKSDILSYNEKVCIIEAGCSLLMKKNDSVIRRLYSWVLGNMKSEEENLGFVNVKTDVALKAFVRAMQNLFKAVPTDAKTAKAPVQIVKTIFEDNEGLTERLLPEISSTMVRYLETYKEGHNFSAELATFGKSFLCTDKHLTLIWQALGAELSELIGEQNYKRVLETINLIKFFLKVYDSASEKFSSKSKYLKPIFSRILMSMNSLSENLECMENTIPGLKLISEIILILEKETNSERFALMSEGIGKFVEFYNEFLNRIRDYKTEKDDESWKYIEEAFLLATRNVVAIQVYIDPKPEEIDWLNKMVDSILNPDTLCEISVICIEGIISIYEKQRQKHSSYSYLQSIIHRGSESVECESKESKIIARLWDMIGESPNDRKVVELVKRADNVMPLTLTTCVINKLLDENMDNKITAVNKFALFWKLALEFFPTFVPFTTEPLCLFHMIDFLDNDHPLVRHSSKNWLAESSRKLDRILDPIINRLLKNTEDETCNKEGQLIYSMQYDTGIVIDAFKRLRSILQASRNELMKFMIENTASSELLERVVREKARSFCNIVDSKSNYLQLLLFLSMKYIRGQAKKELGNKFLTDNAAVNACGCEFIELLITNVEPPDKAPEVASWVIRPLLEGLYNTFISDDNVMQVEILKIIRLIQFKSSSQSKQYVENCITILNDKRYFDILNKGLDSKVSYVRSYYISYVKSTLNFFTIFLGSQLGEHISRIMECLKNNLGKCSSISTTRMGEGKLIANENDVLQILSGLKAVVHHYFFNADAVLESPESIESQKYLPPQIVRKNKEYVEQTKSVMLESIGELFIKAQRIWKMSKHKSVKDFKLTHYGILPFTSKCYTDTLDLYYKESFSFESIAKNFTSYQEGIIGILSPVVSKYPNQTIRSVVNVWLKEHEKNNDEALRKIIDILLCLQIPLEDIISGIITNLESSPEIKSKKSSSKGPIEVEYSIAWRESSICFFLYSYLVYTYDWYVKDKKPEEKFKSLKLMWNNLVQLFKILMTNKNPTTLCWMYDIMYLMGTKYDPRDVAQQERKVRKSIEEVIGQLTADTAMISVTQNGISVDEKFSLAIAFNPSIYEQLVVTEIVEEEKSISKSFDEILTMKLKKIMPQLPRSSDKIIRGPTCYYCLRGFCFMTMRARLFELTEKMLGVTNKDRMTSVLNTVMASLFPLIAQRDDQFGECAADVLYSVLRTKDEYIAFRRQIVEIFLSDDFFVVNQRSLKKWKLILNWLLTFDKNELFTELVNQLSAKATLLSSKSYELTKKYQALKRLAFLILSGIKDHFDECYALLLTKFMEGIRDADNLILVAQYLTLLRVMFLRFGQLNEPNKETAKNMQTLWPNLLCKLIQIFQDSEVKPDQYAVVILASLRVLEIMSVLNIEDHTLFQWVFVVDSFGWKVITNELLDETSEKPVVLRNDKRGFNPFCFNVLSSKFTATFMNEAEGNDKIEMGESLSQELQDRRLIFTKNTDMMLEITQAIIKYICYLSMRNVSSTKLDLEVIEEQVERDFVSEKSDTIQ